MALYRKMLDPALKSSSKQPMFLNLLYKSMKKDISDRRVQVKQGLFSYLVYGLITLTETDLGTDSDSDSIPDGYILLCKTCSHYGSFPLPDSDSDSNSDSDSKPYGYMVLCRTCSH